MTDDNITNFQNVLKLRTELKAVSQLSWNINQLEKRYPLEASTDKEIEGLRDAYLSYVEDLRDICDNLDAIAKTLEE